MTGDAVVELLGATASDNRVRRALAVFDLAEPDLTRAEDNADTDWYVWRPSSSHGLELGFQDAAHLEARDRDLRGRGPLILSSVCFYGEHDGVDPFAGTLPFGLMLQDGPAAVRAKLGPAERLRRSHIRDTWELFGKRLVVGYDSRGTSIASVLVKLPMRAWPPLLDAPDPPDLKVVASLFGHNWHSRTFRETFVPFGLEACGSDIARHRYADLRASSGMELMFSRNPSRGPGSPTRDKGAIFSGIKLYRERYLDARGWGGVLPFGLTFDDPLPVVRSKVGREPDLANDRDLSGFALWHFKEVSLHVLYQNVDNVVLTVSLLRSGKWESAVA